MATSEDDTSIDWDICVLCQLKSDDSQKLQSPMDSKRFTPEHGYTTLADSIMDFQRIGALPLPINTEKLNEGEGIAETFKKHGAKWHNNCRLKFNKKEFTRANKRKMDTECPSNGNDSPMTAKRCKRNTPSASSNIDICFFCDEKGKVGEDLHEATTFTVDLKVRECAMLLQDMDLIRKLAGGDLIAQEAKYHVKCLVKLYNRKRAHEDSSKNDHDSLRVNEGIALAELLAYIEDVRSECSPDDENLTILQLSDLTKLYKNRLEQLIGKAVPSRIHSTELKNRILNHFPELRAYKNKNRVLLAFEDDVGLALKKAFENDYDTDAIHLSKCAKIIRKEVLSKKYVFNGTFEKGCQKEAIPPSLLSLIQMLMVGPNIKAQSEESVSQAAVSISQLIQYNTYKRQKNDTVHTRHNRDRETPFALFLGVLIHGKTRNRELIDLFYKYGLSVSYDRVLSVSTDLANAILAYFSEDGVVCPPALRKGVFTVAAYDNIDHNPSSTSAQSSLHGTSISMFQEVTEENPGIERPNVLLHQNAPKSATIKALPDHYTVVPAAALYRKNPPISAAVGTGRSEGQLFPNAVHEEYRYN